MIDDNKIYLYFNKTLLKYLYLNIWEKGILFVFVKGISLPLIYIYIYIYY